MKKSNKMYCLVYRIRKSNPDTRVNVRQRTVFAGYTTDIDRKTERLHREFNFVIQLEIR
jgi:hypothetical protein